MGNLVRWLPAPAGLLMAALASSAAGAVDQITMRIEVHGLAGMHVASGRTVISETGDRYAITGDTQTLGAAGLFQDLKKHSEARGRLVASGAQPETYHDETHRNGTERRDKVDFRAASVASGSSTPPDSGAAVPSRGAVDPLTAYFLVERQLGRGGDCAMKVPVFDGHNRYNLVFTDAGEQTLSPSGGQKYSGAAKACRMQREAVSGYPNGENDMPRQGTIWYARLVPGDLMLPVRLKMATAIGTVDGYLAKLHGRGKDLRLTD